jgi:hypothetical protein
MVWLTSVPGFLLCFAAFTCLFWVWFYWQKMMSLRKEFFLSKKFQRSIQSRSIMVRLFPPRSLKGPVLFGWLNERVYIPLSGQVTNIKKEYQSDEGLKQLMMQLRGGDDKLASNIQHASIGRDLKDYPQQIEDYNNTIKEFEEVLVKYLKGGREAKHRPMIRRGGFMGMGGTKVDAIEFYGSVLFLSCTAAARDFRD